MWGANEVGQLGLGNTDEKLEPQPLQPEVKRNLAARHGSSSVSRDVMLHPLKGVKVVQIAAGGGHTTVAALGGRQVWTMGSGAYGFPEQRNPTIVQSMNRRVVDKKERRKALVLESTFVMLKPHEVQFRDLRAQIILYGLYTDSVLYRALPKLFEQALLIPENIHIYSQIIETIALHALAISNYAFRRIIVDVIEDICVRLLLKQKLASDKQNIRNGTMFATVRDKETLAEFALFRKEIKALAEMIKELYVTYNLFEDTDIIDLAGGCPGSQHSTRITDSMEAQLKLNLLRTIIKLAGLGFDGQPIIKVQEDVSQKYAAKKKKVVEPVPAMYFSAGDEAAWDAGTMEGWDDYRLADEPEELQRGWSYHVEEMKKHQQATKRLSGKTTKRLESSLAPSFHRDNINMTFSRRELEWQVNQIGRPSDGTAMATAVDPRSLNLVGGLQLEPQEAEAELKKLLMEEAVQGKNEREMELLDTRLRRDPRTGFISREDQFTMM